MSNGKRLALGLIILVVGCAVAVPFRHEQPPEHLRAQISESGLTLGEDVALQVPGQAAAAQFQPLPDTPSDEEQETLNERPAPPPEPSPLTAEPPPPALPDRYLPLTGNELSTRSRPAPITRPSILKTDKPQPPRRHTIHDGDTLESLAIRYYSDPAKAEWIRESNPTVLTVPGVLPIGEEIIIPDPNIAPRSQRQPAVGDFPPDLDGGDLVPLPTGIFPRMP
jgi:phage tail protein X